MSTAHQPRIADFSELGTQLAEAATHASAHLAATLGPSGKYARLGAAHGAHALREEIEAEQARPRWKTGEEITEGDYAGIRIAVFDPEGKPRAFATSASVADQLAEAMTVLMRLEDEGAALPASQADLEEYRQRAQQLATENNALRERVEQLTAERDAAVAKAKAWRRERDEHHRRVAELEAERDRLDAEIVNAGHDAVAATVARSKAADLIRSALAALDDIQ